MIIKFDRTPEEYFRLSRIAFEHKELDRALLYGEKAVRGKGTAEYKLSYAEILFAMERYPETIDVAFDVLCHAKGMRAETYDLLARTAGELGLLYESLHYISKKARYEGDDDTLDAMDEVIQELGEEEESREEGNLFVVGKEEKPEENTILMRASLSLSHGDADQALVLASEIGESSKYYLEARIIIMRALLSKKENDLALKYAEDLVKIAPKNGYVIFILIDRYKQKQYLPLLAEAEGGSRELYYAIMASENLKEHAISRRLSEKLLVEKPYSATSHWIAAAVALNDGDRAKSEEMPRRLFALYPNYPAPAILKGWKRLKSCDAIFEGSMPAKVLRILKNYVRNHAEDAEFFARSMMTDETFRSALLLLFDENDGEVTENILRFLSLVKNKQIDEFFAKMLTRYEIDLVLKCSIMSVLLLRKEKGRLPLSQGVMTQNVTVSKPTHYDSYSDDLKRAFSNVYSFIACLTDSHGEKRVAELTEAAYALGDTPYSTKETLCGAFLYVLLSEGVIPASDRSNYDGECRFILSFVFHIGDVSMTQVKKMVKILTL